MDIRDLMNPMGGGGGSSASAKASASATATVTKPKRKRSVEQPPPPSEPEPKRPRIELNGYEVHPPELQGQGAHGLYRVPAKVKVREIPKFAQKYATGAKMHIPPRQPSAPSDFPDYNGPKPDKPRALSSSHGLNGQKQQQQQPPGSAGRGSTMSPATGPKALPPPPPPPSAPLPTTWEVNILDEVALDQFNRTVADWLFTTVVNAPHLGAHAAWEVEAKLGHLIDQSTNHRLHLPALTDFVLDPVHGPRVAFKSTMTEGQHRAFNGFLNDALMRSLPPKEAATPLDKPRIAISYKHTRQTDTFYELTMADAKQFIPPAVLALSQSAQHRVPRVRVSTDQKTGAELARIVKLRVSDLDIHSPATPFDVRISVNVEVACAATVDELERLAANAKRRSPTRSKDRMTYNHLAYQIDLTQVTTTEGGNVLDKEHELEIEICGMDQLRHQGARLKSGESSNYMQLVNGFVENIRLLQRQLARAHQ